MNAKLDSLKRASFFVVAMILFAATIGTIDASGAVYEPDRQETYKRAGPAELKLHIFEPPSHQVSDQAPAVVFFFVIKGHDEEGEDLTVSSIPNAMILFNPVLDTTARGCGLKRVGKSRQTEISPCHHVRAGIVPTLLFHGTADKTVPFENAERFNRLMKEAGNTCQLESFPGQGHGFFNGAFFRPKIKDTSHYTRTMKESVAFLTSLGYLSSPKASGR